LSRSAYPGSGDRTLCQGSAANSKRREAIEKAQREENGRAVEERCRRVDAEECEAGASLALEAKKRIA
jgi:hypothetical protein